MKFELKPNNRNASDQEYLDDLNRVAKESKSKTLTMENYVKGGGRFSPSAVHRKFGSWIKALEKAGLDSERRNTKLLITKDDVIIELKLIAKNLGKQTLTTSDYDNYTGRKYSSQSISKIFEGSWLKAMDETGLNRSRTLGITNEQYFENIENVWISLGRQPLYREIEKPLSLYSSGAYEARFGTWRKALEAFIEYINSDDDENIEIENNILETIQKNEIKLKHKTKRNPSNRLKFRVLMRDGFICKECKTNLIGWDNLRFDHINPWAKGGETEYENLQVLCKICNAAKGDLEYPE